MPDRLTNKIAIITGSSSGIGRAIALAFASEGATIILSDLREEARPELSTDASPLTTTQLLTSLGTKALFVKCDTTSSTDMQTLIQDAVKAFGRVDIMVNNAGVSLEGEWHGEKPIWEYDDAAFEQTMQVNAKGVFLGTKYASRQMVGQEVGPSGDRGWIVNVSSVFGLVGKKGICKFCFLSLSYLPSYSSSSHIPSPRTMSF